MKQPRISWKVRRLFFFVAQVVGLLSQVMGNYGSFPGARLESTQWLFLVPLKGGIGGIVHPPIGSIYVYIYIYCLLGGYIIAATYYQNLKNPLIYPKVLLKNCGSAKAGEKTTTSIVGIY